MGGIAGLFLTTVITKQDIANKNFADEYIVKLPMGQILFPRKEMCETSSLNTSADLQCRYFPGFKVTSALSADKPMQ